MKTRDELAEALLLASVATDPVTQSTGSMSPKAAFDRADEFFAERKRRAAPTADARGECCCYSGCEDDTAIHQHADEPCPLHPDRPFAIGRAPLREEVAAPVAPHSPDDGCAGCEHYRDETSTAERHCGAASITLMFCDSDAPAPSWCPKRAAPPAPALRFDDHGDLLNAGGIDSADTITDGYAAYRDDVECAVYFRATNREHAERIVAAVLPVGRGTP